MHREIILHGELARHYGKHHRLDVSSPAEAVRALAANFPGFEAHLATSQRRGVGYQVWDSGHNLDTSQLHQQGSGRIYISPVVLGSKRAGVLQTILGAVLIVVGVVLDFTPAAAASPYFYEVGGALLLGGIAQLLTPVPKADGGTSDTRSNYFDGAVNTTGQGNPVPVGYGRLLIGGAVISAGISLDTHIVDAAAPA